MSESKKHDLRFRLFLLFILAPLCVLSYWASLPGSGNPDHRPTSLIPAMYSRNFLPKSQPTPVVTTVTTERRYAEPTIPSPTPTPHVPTMWIGYDGQINFYGSGTPIN